MSAAHVKGLPVELRLLLAALFTLWAWAHLLPLLDVPYWNWIIWR